MESKPKPARPVIVPFTEDVMATGKYRTKTPETLKTEDEFSITIQYDPLPQPNNFVMSVRHPAFNRLLVCGSRHWDDKDFIEAILDNLFPRTRCETIIHGNAEGADAIANAFAVARGYTVCRYPAKWKLYGRKAAGPIRNTEMLAKGKPGAVVAFHDDFDHSKGTKDMVTKALNKGLVVYIFSHGNEEPNAEVPTH